MDDNEDDDDFMCIRVGGGKTVATCKGVTVVASRLEGKSENYQKETAKFTSRWRRLINRLIMSRRD